MTQSAGALGRPRFFVWTGTILLVLYLVIAGGGGAGGTLVPAFRIATLFVLVVTLGIWTLVAWRRPERRPATTLWPAIIAVLAAFLVPTIASWNLRLSIEFLAYAVLLLTLYLLLVQILRDPALRPRMVSLAALLSGFIAVLYIWVVVGHWIRWWDAVGFITTPPLRPGFEGLSYGNPSAVAAITLLFLAPAVAWLSGRGRIGLVGIGALVVLVGTTVVLTGSRGAWLALGIAVLATGLALVLQSHLRRMIWAQIQRVPRLGIVAVMGIAAVVVIAAGPAILGRLAGGGDALRVTLNLTALRMFAEDPITGSGPGTWVVRRAAFTEPQEVDYYIPHAHNVFTQGIGEFGLVGVAAALVVGTLVARLVFRALRDDDHDRQRMAMAAVFGLTYFAVHQLVDMYMNIPAIMFAAVLPVAYLDATAIPARGASNGPARGQSFAAFAEGRAGLAVIALACAISMVWLGRIESAAVTSLNASVVAIDDDMATAARLSREALTADPDLPAYWFQTGLATATEDPAAALELLRRSAETDDFTHAWLNVANLELDRDDQVAALDALERAMRLGWQQPAVAFAAGALYVRLNEPTLAVEAFGQALARAPDLGDDPFWTSDPDIAAVHDPAVDRAMSIGGPYAAPFIALFGGRPDDARALAAALPGEEGRVALLAIEAWDGDDKAQAQLVAMAEARPLNTAPVVWSALLASKDGDEAATNRFRVWAGLVGGSLGTAIGQDTVVTDKPFNRRQVAGPNANFHGVYTYRRLYPWDLLVPGLPKLTLE